MPPQISLFVVFLINTFFYEKNETQTHDITIP